MVLCTVFTLISRARRTVAAPIRLIAWTVRCIRDPFAPLGPIGHVDEANGVGAELIQGYVATLLHANVRNGVW